jgi:hypothetical protein
VIWIGKGVPTKLGVCFRPGKAFGTCVPPCSFHTLYLPGRIDAVL